MKATLFRNIVILVYVLLLPLVGIAQRAGELDRSFNYGGTGPNNKVQVVVTQTDGKIIIGGDFTTYNGIPRNRIARLNSDGSLDTSFNPGIGFNNRVTSMAIQSDGKPIICGRFTSYNGTTVGRIACLNLNGSLDTSFRVGTGADGNVECMTLQSDDKILIGGLFDGVNRIVSRAIARLNINGSVDTSFGSFARRAGRPYREIHTGTVWTIASQSNGKIIVGGSISGSGAYARGNITRLNSDGSTDASFEGFPGAGGSVYSTLIQPDGKLILGGAHSTYDSFSRRGIARAETNGIIDPSFNASMGSTSVVLSVISQSDSKLIIGGRFGSINGNIRNSLARLGANGSLDTSFNPGLGADSSIIWSCIQSSNKLIIGGSFANYNGSPTPYLARILLTDCEPSSGPNIIAPDTILLCSSDSTILTSSATSGNLWSTGDTTRSITASQAGSYTVRSINNSCTSAISNPITVSVIAPPAPQIAFDSVGNRCLGSEIIVSVAGNHNQFRWNTGATTRNINVRRTGDYSAEVLDSSGCWSLPSRPARIVFDTAFCIIRISIIGLDSLEASIYADRYEWFLDGIQLLTGNNGKVIPIQGNGVYTVRAIIDGRTSPMSEPIVITSGKKSLATKFEVYPNPASNKVTVNTTGSGTLEILNTLGQVVINQPATATNEINISKLAIGVYSVRFNGINKMLVVK